MARRVIVMDEVLEVIYQWHKGQNNSEIAHSLGVNRKTVKKYLHMAKGIGLKREEALPEGDEILNKLRQKGWLKKGQKIAPIKEKIAAFHKEIEQLLKQGVSFKQIWRLIGERMRKVWAFAMTLSYSRYPFVRFVYRMNIDTWIDCHIRAFEFFSGVPKKIVLDNLKSGIVKADIYDPTLNPTYAELERYYGFIADPARAGCPKDKPRVERMIRTVKGQILSGRSFRDIEEANRYALSWSRYQYGLEPHGTTKRPPYEVFEKEEKPL